MVTGKRYVVRAPRLGKRFMGEYVPMVAWCVDPRWPAVTDAGDFEIADGRRMYLPSQQVLGLC